MSRRVEKIIGPRAGEVLGKEEGETTESPLAGEG